MICNRLVCTKMISGWFTDETQLRQSGAHWGSCLSLDRRVLSRERQHHPEAVVGNRKKHHFHPFAAKTNTSFPDAAIDF